MTNNKEDIFMVEILQAINDFATTMEERFNQVDERFDKFNSKIDYKIDELRQEMNEYFIAHDRRFDYIEGWLRQIEKRMATKSQFNSLLGVLERKDIISKYEMHHISTSELSS